jgi:hypothetical protein
VKPYWSNFGSLWCLLCCDKYYSCNTSNDSIMVMSGYSFWFQSPVDCSSKGRRGGGGGDFTAHPTPIMIGISQDIDGYGIPDSVEGCANHSNLRCFKGGTQ